MSERKIRREIDKAIRHLIDYDGPSGEWAGRQEALEEEFLAPVADQLNLGLEEAYAYFFDGPFGHMAFGFLFEEYATVRWDNEEQSLTEAYVKHRGWREGTAGRRYLQALGDSELTLWEITSVQPGVHVDIREYGSKDKPVRVKEKAATENLQQWDCLAARVLPLGKGHIFSGALLPFSPNVAARMHRVLAEVPVTTRRMMQELVDRGEIDKLPDDMDDLLREAVADELPRVVFRFWAVDVYAAENRLPPLIRNTENDPIELTQVRFPLRGARATIASALDSSAVLDREADDPSWVWLTKPVEDLTPDDRISVLGHITLKDTSLQLDANSLARAERGGSMLAALLGDLVGAPLAVHDSQKTWPEESDPIDVGADLPPELQEAMEAFATDHYRKTLDQAIPMLNGRTPRECAADPTLRHDVIAWLKYLENSDARAPGPSNDFGWMWDELNLERD